MPTESSVVADSSARNVCEAHLCAVSVLTSVGTTNLPPSCPGCGHSPLSPDACEPNRNARGTARAYLLKERKALGNERAKSRNEEQPTPDTAETTKTSNVTIEPIAEAPDYKALQTDEEPPQLVGQKEEIAQVDQQLTDVPQPSIEVGIFSPVYCASADIPIGC